MSGSIKICDHSIDIMGGMGTRGAVSYGICSLCKRNPESKNTYRTWEASERMEELQTENKILLEAVKFYGDKNNWVVSSFSGTRWKPSIVSDCCNKTGHGGFKARKALLVVKKLNY